MQCRGPFGSPRNCLLVTVPFAHGMHRAAALLFLRTAKDDEAPASVALASGSWSFGRASRQARLLGPQSTVMKNSLRRAAPSSCGWASLVIALGLAAAALSPSSAVWAQTKPATANSKAAPGPDEKAVRATAEAFTKAFNAGDAKTLGGLWASDAEYTDEAGNVLLGREAIEQEYAKLLKDNAGAVLALAIQSIRFLAPDVALEKGIARVRDAAGENEAAARYTITHVKRDGRWIMSVGRDEPYVPASNSERLKGLGWLIGDWASEGGERGLRSKCEWMAQQNFIRNTFTRVKEDKTAVTGLQLIGWDPRLGAIVSWHFDADGGFGHDVWTRDGSSWEIEATGLSRDGNESSAVNLLTPIDANSFAWQSRERTLNGAPLADTATVKMIRVPANK